jgi:Ala-tRNA(Pro) deacylase
MVQGSDEEWVAGILCVRERSVQVAVGGALSELYGKLIDEEHGAVTSEILPKPRRGAKFEYMPVPAALAAAFAVLGIDVPCYEHPPLRTVEDAHVYWDPLPGTQVKNLFLRDAGKQLWLVVVPGDPRMDTKALAALIGSKRLSFGTAELLREVLGVEPGAVTPLAVMNDTARRVRTVLHARLMKAELLLVHPLVNTATVQVPPAELVRFMTAQHVVPALVDLTPAFQE